METRLDRNKKMKKRKRIKKMKFIFVLILFGFMVQGLMIVNQNIIDLKCIENPTILDFDFNTKELNLFGKAYILDFKILKESQ